MDSLVKISVAFQQGGMWMWVILLFQIAAIAITVERVVSLYFKRKPELLGQVDQFEDLIKKGQLKQVMENVKTVPSSLARVVSAGVAAAQGHGGKGEIQGKMDEVLLQENSLIEQRTGFLAMLANVGTLTGLLGTIVGMIKSFASISYANPAEKATMLSTGISEAMNTTAYGLIMAIPSLVCFAILTNRANKISEDLNQASLKVFNWLSYSYENIPVKASKNSISN